MINVKKSFLQLDLCLLTSSVSPSPSPSSSTEFPVPSDIISFTVEQNLAKTFRHYRAGYYVNPLAVKHQACTITRAQTNTDTYTDTSRGVSSPTALFLRGEVDLEVVRIVVDVEEAAALVELTDTTHRNGKEDGIKTLQPPHRKAHLNPYLMPFMDMAVKFHSWIPFYS